MRPIHGTRRGAFEVDALAVATTAMTRALEFVFAGFPIGSAAQVSAPRVDDEHAIGSAIHPDAVFLLPLNVHSESVVRGVADLENCGRLEERARKEKFEKGNKPRAKKSSNHHPHQSSPLPVVFSELGTDGRQTASG